MQNIFKLWQRLLICFALICLFIGVVYLILFILKNKIAIPCVINKYLNVYCPGCGSARATNALLHLKFLDAINYNLAYCIIMPLVILYFFIRVIDYTVTGKNRIDMHISKKLLYGVFIGLIVFAVLRNIPIMPFKWLAP